MFFQVKSPISLYIPVNVLSALVSSNSPAMLKIVIQFSSFLFTSTKVSIKYFLISNK
jgi:hypothetical protein